MGLLGYALAKPLVQIQVAHRWRSGVYVGVMGYGGLYNCGLKPPLAAPPKHVSS